MYKSLVNFINANKAAIYNNVGLMSKTLSGPLIVFLLTSKLSASEQGLYYAFLSIAGIQIIFELGFSTAIVQNLAYYRPTSSYFKAYSKLSVLFFFISSILLFGALIFCGEWYFKDIEPYIWRNQWLMFSLALSINIFMTFFYVIKEGNLEYDSVYKIRLYSSLVYAVSLIASLLLGAKMWALFTSQLGMLFVSLLCFKSDFKYVLNIVRKTNKKRVIIVLRKLIKFQVKLSIIWLTGYFYWNGFTLFFFKYESPEFAGKIAISIAILTSLANAASSFVRAKRSLYGKLISEAKNHTAFSIFIRSSGISFLVYLFGCAVFAGLVFLYPENEYIRRFTNINIIILLIVFRLLVLSAEIMAIYLRAYRDEPFFKVTLITNLSVPIIIWVLYLMSLTNLIFQVIVAFHVCSLMFQIKYFRNKVYMAI